MEVVVDSGTLNLPAAIDTLPLKLLSATYTVTADQVNTLLKHVGATDFNHYLKLSDGTTTVEKEVSFSGTQPTLSFTNTPTMELVADPSG